MACAYLIGVDAVKIRYMKGGDRSSVGQQYVDQAEKCNLLQHLNEEEEMKRNKILALAAAGVLTAATAVPALAMENEFHGSFTAFYDLSNYSAGFGGYDYMLGLAKNAKTENYFVQRARLGYTAKVSDQVKLNTKFELDYTKWGNSSYTTGRNTGGGLGADSVQIETKNVFLELNYPTLNTKIGMMPYNDSFKGILFDADMAGILFSHNYTNASVAAGFFRFGDDGPVSGRNTYDMISLDGKYALGKDTKVGAAYYYINDNRTTPGTYGGLTGGDANIHSVGLNAEGAVGPVNLSGFAITQFGDRNDAQKAKGYALNLAAKVAVMGGTLRSDFLYVGGGKNAFYNPYTENGGSEGGGYYDAEMIILNRDKNAKTFDRALVYDANNFNQGVIMGSIGYDHACTDKITSSINAGFAAVAKNNGQNVNSKSDYIGTEINLESNYKLTPNVTLGVRGGYVFLGDYFKGADAGRTPDNPYDLKVLANLAF
jgi:hypothetical protein